jgi:hypothetical protein
MIFRASEPRGATVQVGDGNAARQAVGMFASALFVLFEDYSLEIRTPDARQVLVYFREVKFEALPEYGVLSRARMRGKIESGAFAGATVRVTANTRETGLIDADVQLVLGAEPRDDVPSWWPPEDGQASATLDVS